jgi:hypothetical protein
MALEGALNSFDNRIEKFRMLHNSPEKEGLRALYCDFGKIGRAHV